MRAHVLVKDVMSTPPVTVGVQESVKRALELMDRHRVSSLPVVAHHGHIVGLVSEGDVLRDRLPRTAGAQLSRRHDRAHLPTTVAQVMSRPLTVEPGTELEQAVDLMTTTSVRSLPVLEEDRVIGMVSRSDIVHVLARGDADIHDDVATALRRAELSCVVEIFDGIVSLGRLDDPQSAPAAHTVAAAVSGVVAVQIFT
jgi:CBS domain-containing protein